jgi:hypothetical protein
MLTPAYVTELLVTTHAWHWRSAATREPACAERLDALAPTPSIPALYPHNCWCQRLACRVKQPVQRDGSQESNHDVPPTHAGLPRAPCPTLVPRSDLRTQLDRDLVALSLQKKRWSSFIHTWSALLYLCPVLVIAVSRQ